MKRLLMDYHFFSYKLKTQLRARALISLLGLICMFGLYTSSATANPTSGTIGAGNVVITNPAPNKTQINQTTQKGIINWKSFNIGPNEYTHFQQPVGGVTLNRINPTQGVSSIYGHLSSTGQIILINPAGIYFGPTAFVNVGGLIASTADITDVNFLNGVYRFNYVSPYSGSIINQGAIIAADHGLVALIGNSVQNNGLIQANFGKVILASGNAFTMTFVGSDLISFSVDEKSSNDMGITNTGTLRADGGSILITARAASGVLDKIINLEGIVQARSAGMQNGELVLYADTGVVRVAAKIDVSGKQSGERGGRVKITGQHVVVDSTAIIDASGNAGGGEILIGGDLHGAGSLANAETTTIKSGALILANAVVTGEGGKIIVWSNNVTTYEGYLAATGGSTSGDGGFAEVSGHKLLNFHGTVDLSAVKGLTGILLLDPENLTIQTAGPTTATFSSGTYTSNIDDSILTVADLQLALANANVLVQTGTGGLQVGDITLANDVTWSNSNTLTLSAFRNINMNAAITNSLGGSLILKADNTGVGAGTIIFSGATPQITMSGGGVVNLFYNPTSFPTPTNFASNISASGGTTVTAYMLVNNLTNLQNINNNLSGNYALGANIDATPTLVWNAGAGFTPIGTSAANFTGQFDGQNYTINNLTIFRPIADSVGLFGYVNTTGSIQNVGLTNAAITGLTNVGALIGFDAAGNVINAYSTGTVTSDAISNNVGGLVGYAGGNISNSYSTSTVLAGATSNYIGGLAGQSAGNITNSYHATGSVTVGAASHYVGGLVGYSLGSVSQSYNTGAVEIGATGSTNLGGLIGYSVGPVSGSYSAGSVTAGAAVTNVGGLIGYGFGTVDTSYSTGAINTGATGSANIGGLVGYAGNNISNSYSHSSILGGAANINIGGLVGQNNAIISNSYSTGNVASGAGSAFLGGLVGLNNATVNNSFWDTQTSGQLASAGGAGRTTAQMMQQTTFCPSGNCSADPTHFDFATNWGIINGLTYPFLQVLTQSISGQVFSNINGTTPVANNIVSLASEGVILNGLAISQSQATSDATGFYYFLLNKSYYSQTTPMLAFIDLGPTAGNTLFIPFDSAVTANIYGDTIYNQGTGPLSNSLLAAAKGSLVNTGILYSSIESNLSLGNATHTTANFFTSSVTPYSINGNITPTSGSSNTFTFNGPVTVSGSSVVLAGQMFTNNSASFTVDPSVGTFLIWSGNPAADNRGDIVFNFKQYNATFGVTSVLGTGTGFLYTLAPFITPSLIGTVTKTYDANTDAILASGNYANTGAIDGDTVLLNNPTVGIFDTKDVGINKNISVSGLSIASATDGSATVYGYQLTSPLANANIGEITPATLTYNANTASMIYGGAVPSLSGTVSGFVGGETQITATTGILAFTSLATSNSNVGNYLISGSGLTADSGNYIFNQAAGNATALTINPATLTYNANAGTMTYGSGLPAFTGTVTGFVNSQTQASATTGTLAFTSLATSSSNVGDYLISGSGLTANNGNYLFTQAAGNATAFSITPASLTLTANSQSKIYGETLTLGTSAFTSSGLQNSETVGAVTLASAGADVAANVSDNPFAIGISGATGGTFTASNYNIQYVDGVLTINPATLTYNANAATMTYGSATPAFSGTVTGFVNNQTQASATTGSLAFNSSGTSSSNVGSYAIDGSGLTANNGNYLFTQATSNATAFTITPTTQPIPPIVPPVILPPVIVDPSVIVSLIPSILRIEPNKNILQINNVLDLNNLITVKSVAPNRASIVMADSIARSEVSTSTQREVNTYTQRLVPIALFNGSHFFGGNQTGLTSFAGVWANKSESVASLSVNNADYLIAIILIITFTVFSIVLSAMHYLFIIIFRRKDDDKKNDSDILPEYGDVIPLRAGYTGYKRSTVLTGKPAATFPRVERV